MEIIFMNLLQAENSWFFMVYDRLILEAVSHPIPVVFTDGGFQGNGCLRGGSCWSRVSSAGSGTVLTCALEDKLQSRLPGNLSWALSRLCWWCLSGWLSYHLTSLSSSVSMSEWDDSNSQGEIRWDGLWHSWCLSEFGVLWKEALRQHASANSLCGRWSRETVAGERRYGTRKGRKP